MTQQLFDKKHVATGISKNKILIIIGSITLTIALFAGYSAEKFNNKRKMANRNHNAVTDVNNIDSYSVLDRQLNNRINKENAQYIVNNNLNPAVINSNNVSNIDDNDTDTKLMHNINTNNHNQDNDQYNEYNDQLDSFKLPPLNNGKNQDNKELNYSVANNNNINNANMNRNNINYRTDNINDDVEKAKQSPIGIINNNNINSNAGNNSDSNDYAAQNAQNSKTQFLTTQNQIIVDYNKAITVKPISKYELKTGSLIPSVLKTAINSDLPTQIISAIVRENVYDSKSGRYMLIPRGSTLIGRYDAHVSYGQNRLLVAWNRIIFPNGNSYNFNNGFAGSDEMARAGFSGSVDEHYWRLFGASFIMGAITGSMSYASGANNSTTSPNLSQTMSQSVGQQAGQTGMAITQKNLNIQPTIIIDAGYKFNIIIASDCVLLPL